MLVKGSVCNLPQLFETRSGNITAGVTSIQWFYFISIEMLQNAHVHLYIYMYIYTFVITKTVDPRGILYLSNRFAVCCLHFR